MSKMEYKITKKGFIHVTDKRLNKLMNPNKIIYPNQPCKHCNQDTRYKGGIWNKYDGEYYFAYNKCINDECVGYKETVTSEIVKCISCEQDCVRDNFDYNLDENGGLFKYILCNNCDVCICRQCKNPIFIPEHHCRAHGDLCYDCANNYRVLNETLFEKCFHLLDRKERIPFYKIYNQITHTNILYSGDDYKKFRKMGDFKKDKSYFFYVDLSMLVYIKKNIFTTNQIKKLK